MKKSKTVRNVLVVFAVVFMSVVLCGAGCSNVASGDSNGGSSGGGGGSNPSGGEVKAATTAEAIAAINNLKAGQTLKLELGSGVTMTTEFLQAVYGVSNGGKIELGLPQTTTIDDDDFIVLGQCPAVTAINVDPGNAKYSSVAGILYNRDKTKLVSCPAGKTGDVNVPTGVISIGRQAFYACEFLTGVSIPSGVVTISEYAFAHCELIRSVNIPTTVATIDCNAFLDCKSLTSVTVNRDVPPSSNVPFAFGLASLLPSSLKIYVPASAVAAYKAAPEWSAYADRIFQIQ